MRALLDVNVLIALLDANHTHHQAAHQWLGKRATHGWASCPITQNGCVRIMSDHAYPNAQTPAAVIERLRVATRSSAHEFWEDDVSLLDAGRFHVTKLHASRLLTDAYLVSVAVRRGGRFVTFDRTVDPSPVVGATAKSLVILD